MTKAKWLCMLVVVATATMAFLYFAVYHQIVNPVDFVSGLLLWFMAVLSSLFFIDKYGAGKKEKARDYNAGKLTPAQRI